MTNSFARRALTLGAAVAAVTVAVAGPAAAYVPSGWSNPSHVNPLHLIAIIVFALIIGIWFVIAGIARLVEGFAEREGRAGNLAVAALDIVAGIVILAWPDLTLSTFAVILGIVLILRGALLIYAGWQLRAVDREIRA